MLFRIKWWRFVLKNTSKKVFNGYKSIETFPIIDEGSKLSLLDLSLLDEESIRIKWSIKNYFFSDFCGQESKTFNLRNVKAIKYK